MTLAQEWLFVNDGRSFLPKPDLWAVEQHNFIPSRAFDNTSRIIHLVDSVRSVSLAPIGNVSEGGRMRFVKHLGRLLGEFFAFAWHNKAWWIVPIVLMLLLLAVLIAAGHGLAPFIYTIF
jgi:hypothetical protein